MSTQELLKSLAKQCQVVNRLVEEAEASKDGDQSRLLFGMAKDESENISKSLRTHLSRKKPGHHLTAA